MIALVDADSIVYRVAFSCQSIEEGELVTAADFIVKGRTDEFIEDLLATLQPEEYEIYLTGSTNFRTEIAVTAPYKGNRTQERPYHWQTVRDRLIDRWGAEVTEGEEADDIVAIRASELGNRCVICSIDKDLDQIPGEHYNYVKRERYSVSAFEGLRNFYGQILVGDRSDNVIGVRGLGPVRVAKLFAEATQELDLFRKCLEAFEGDYERLLENGRLLWLRRYSGQLWSPPRSCLDMVPTILKELHDKRNESTEKQGRKKIVKPAGSAPDKDSSSLMGTSLTVSTGVVNTPIELVIPLSPENTSAGTISQSQG